MQSDCKVVTRARDNAPLRNLAMALVLMGLLAASARAQGVRYDNIVLGPSGRPVSSAQIAVCTSAAVRTTTPCSPLANVYSDEALTQPMANPFTADSLGNYGFWAEPGHYVVQIYGTGVTTRTMDVFLACNPSNCSMTSATVSSITAGTLNLTGSLTVDGRNVATEPLASAAVEYVSPNGKDSNSGLSWGTAKQTLYAAVSALESANGGTLYVAPNTACGGPVSGQGLWLVGYVDSSGYANPPSGWIKMQHPLKIVGKGISGVASQNSPAPAAQIHCGSAGANPAIWISGVTWPETLEIDNLGVTTSANNALAIGIATSGARTGSGGSDLTFRNDSFAVADSGTVGPTIDIGANVFWVRFDNVGISANGNAPTALSDAHQAVVVNPTSGAANGSGLLFFRHVVTNGGGIHFYGNAPNNAGSLYVYDYVMENGDDGSPAVWISPTSGAGQYDLTDVSVSDSTVSPTYAVEQDNSTYWPGATTVRNATGNGGNVSGPMTVIGGLNRTINDPPTLQGQQGFYNQTVWAKYINDGNFSFTLENSPWPDLVSPVPTSTVSGVPSWGNLTGSSLTQVTAPDGTQNAYELPASPTGSLYFNDFATYNVTAGDYFIAGGWFKTFGTGYADGEPLKIEPKSSCGSPSVVANTGDLALGFGDRYNNKNWSWGYAVIKMGATASGCEVDFVTNGSGNEAVFAPVMIHIPASAGLTDADALDIGMSLRSTAPLSTAGVYATLPNHPIAFGGSGDPYFATLDHTGLTANRTYDFPNQSGTIALVLSGTSGSIGGSSLAAGACTTGTASIAGATTSMAVAVSPAADPGSGFTWEGWISAAGTATVRVCNVSGASATPAAEAYNVRVIQ